ncbi:nuclear GTPase SLIP-GC-like protein [Labeo rohita]|uniref:Cyclin-dependent kinases regulatory subunit n=1 Tax=Labeo rohita TaxID=84645 RepID=A0A498MEK5_LABRO|nr:nuclear GTPase SLIP-GC-like protein [Labeo rohita]
MKRLNFPSSIEYGQKQQHAMSHKQIYYSDKYDDDKFEYRHVMLPKDIAKRVPKTHLMSETEWRNLGVQQSQGWVHYMIHQPGILMAFIKTEDCDEWKDESKERDFQKSVYELMVYEEDNQSVDSGLTFAVVTLEDTDEVMVVASDWLSTDQKQCYWPPFKSTEKYLEAVKSNLKPSTGEKPWEKLNVLFHEKYDLHCILHQHLLFKFLDFPLMEWEKELEDLFRDLQDDSEDRNDDLIEIAEEKITALYGADADQKTLEELKKDDKYAEIEKLMSIKIPKLQDVLRSLNKSINRELTRDYVSEAKGVLSLIQSVQLDTDKKAAEMKVAIRMDLENNLKVALSEMDKYFDNISNDLEKCLSKGVEESVQSCVASAKALVVPKKDGRGFHKIIQTLCKNYGCYWHKNCDAVLDLNKKLAKPLHENIYENFSQIFPVSGKTGRSVQEQIDKFTIIQSDPAYLRSSVIRHIQNFVKTEESKLKELLNRETVELGKDIYSSIIKTIQNEMSPCYEKAAALTGTGSIKERQDMLVNTVNEKKHHMFNKAKMEVLKKLNQLKLHIKDVLEPGLKKAMDLSLSQSINTTLMDMIMKNAKQIMKKVIDKLHHTISMHNDIISKINKMYTVNIKKTTIGIVGRSGEGKSSLLSAILGKKNLMPSGSFGACTSVVTQEWEKELKDLLTVLSDDSEDSNEDLFEIAVEKITALYGRGADQKTLEELKKDDKYAEIENFITETQNSKKISKSDLSEFAKDIACYVLNNLHDFLKMETQKIRKDSALTIIFFKYLLLNGTTGKSVQEQIDKFTIIQSDSAYTRSSMLRHIQNFIKTQENGQKTKLIKETVEIKKHIYSSILETIKNEMAPCYEEAAALTGTGSMKERQDMLITTVDEKKQIMFNKAKMEALKKLKNLKLHIKSTLKSKLKKAMDTSLSQDSTIKLMGTYEQAKEKQAAMREKEQHFGEQRPPHNGQPRL